MYRATEVELTQDSQKGAGRGGSAQGRKCKNLRAPLSQPLQVAAVACVSRPWVTVLKAALSSCGRLGVPDSGAPPTTASNDDSRSATAI